MRDFPKAGDTMLASTRDRFLAGEGGVSAALARAPLWAASFVYRGIIAVRNAYYDRRAAAVQRVDVPVISVGNITTGGTGKTPVVIDLVTRLRDLGRTPAVVSRGYKRDAAGRSDELTMMRRNVPNLVCVANPDRVAGARQAIAEHGADVIVLDDGFQHRRLARDLDIVLIDATRPFGFGHMLPRGYLREPIENLRRAGAIILTRTDQVSPQAIEAIQRVLARVAPATPTITSRHKPQPLRPLRAANGAAVPFEPAPVYLLSGIGNERAFRQTVDALGMDVRGHQPFPDHHDYAAGEVRDAGATAVRLGASAIITTEKDAVKLERLTLDLPLTVWVLAVKIDFCGDGGMIIDEMLRKL